MCTIQSLLENLFTQRYLLGLFKKLTSILKIKYSGSKSYNISQVLRAFFTDMSIGSVADPDLALSHPDPYWECGSGSRSKPDFQPFKWLLYLRYVGTLFLMKNCLPMKYIFHFKILLFVTAQSDQDPNSQWFGSLDPGSN